jgi:hypothetical protein
MTLKAKSILGLFALALVVTIYLTRCNGNSFHIGNTDQRHEFTVRQTHFHISIDAAIVVEITGELDGKAIVFQPNNGPQDSTGLPVWRDHYSVVKLSKGKIDKKVYVGETNGDFQLIYQPITAKNGSLSIKINY